MKFLVISSSLNPESRSRILAQEALDAFREIGAEVDWLDLQEVDQPFCDGKG